MLASLSGRVREDFTRSDGCNNLGVVLVNGKAEVV